MDSWRYGLVRSLFITNMNVNIDVSGLNKVQGNFISRKEKIKEATQVIIKKSIFLLERYLKIEAPVRTGRLRSSIGGGSFQGGFYYAGEGIELYPTYARIGPTVKYARFVNQRNPFMSRGAAEAVPDIKDMVKNEVKQAINV